ncbi:hypothetical protein P9112_007753 [Eukaryota sp. TZLM1-RC]
MDAHYENILVRHIPSRHESLTIDSKDNILDALTQLLQGYYTAPVVRTSDSIVLGLLDIADIVHYIVTHYGSTTNLIDLCTITPISELISTSKRNPIIPLKESNNLLDAVRILAHVRRVPVFDEGDQCRIVSQTDVLRFLSKNDSLIPTLREKPIGDCFCGVPKQVYNVHVTDKSITAFRLMDEHKIYSVGIVNDHGELVSNISISDVKAILTTKSALFLTETVLDTISRVKSRELVTKSPIIYSTPLDSFINVVKKLSATGVHHVYLTSDGSKKPIGVVALSDILQDILRAEL